MDQPVMSFRRQMTNQKVVIITGASSGIGRTTTVALAKGEHAFVMINCESGREIDVAKQLRVISGVSEVVRTEGPHDIITTIEASTVETLKQLIDHIRLIPYIRTTTVLIKS